MTDTFQEEREVELKTRERRIAQLEKEALKGEEWAIKRLIDGLRDYRQRVRLMLDRTHGDGSVNGHVGYIFRQGIEEVEEQLTASGDFDFWE